MKNFPCIVIPDLSAEKSMRGPLTIAPRTNFYSAQVSDAEKEKLSPEALHFEAISIGGGENDMQVCIVPLDCCNRATALKIVRSYNSHDELISILELTYKALDEMSVAWVTPHEKEIIEVLKRAKGE